MCFRDLQSFVTANLPELIKWSVDSGNMIFFWNELVPSVYSIVLACSFIEKETHDSWNMQWATMKHNEFKWVKINQNEPQWATISHNE